jgi:hypothetical protein
VENSGLGGHFQIGATWAFHTAAGITESTVRVPTILCRGLSLDPGLRQRPSGKAIPQLWGHVVGQQRGPLLFRNVPFSGQQPQGLRR